MRSGWIQASCGSKQLRYRVIPMGAIQLGALESVSSRKAGFLTPKSELSPIFLPIGLRFLHRSRWPEGQKGKRPMKKTQTLTALLCLLLLLGSASLASASDRQLARSPSEVSVADWALDWLGELAQAAADLVSKSFEAESGQPAPDQPLGNAMAESGDSGAEEDDGLLETGTQIEPFG
jgi:hypothetical protein